MAAAGTLTKSTETTALHARTIALTPSKFVFTLTDGLGLERRVEKDNFFDAYAAQYEATTHGFDCSEIVPVHRVEVAR